MQSEAILARIEDIASSTVREEAPSVDQQARWPEQSIRALQKAELGGLVVPGRLGGLGQGLYGLARSGEILGQVSASTALCFGMHCVGTAVIAAKATKAQQKHFLEPIVHGEHLTTLALSKPGTGAHFYYPQTQLLPSPEGFVVKGEKTFVTNGGHADSYVVSTMGADPEAAVHEFSCVVVENRPPAWSGDRPGTGWVCAATRPVVCCSKASPSPIKTSSANPATSSGTYFRW